MSEEQSPRDLVVSIIVKSRDAEGTGCVVIDRDLVEMVGGFGMNFAEWLHREVEAGVAAAALRWSEEANRFPKGPEVKG